MRDVCFQITTNTGISEDFIILDGWWVNISSKNPSEHFIIDTRAPQQIRINKSDLDNWEVHHNTSFARMMAFRKA